MEPIYHIVRRDTWEQARAAGRYAPASLADEGFIHCSYPSQILMPANLLYRGQRGLVLLRIDPALVSSPVRQDTVAVVRGGMEAEEAFPHIYGPLNPDAVMAVIPFPPQADGRFALPPELAS